MAEQTFDVDAVGLNSIVTTTYCPLATAKGFTPLDSPFCTSTKPPRWVSSRAKLVTAETVKAPPEASFVILAVTFTGAESVPHCVDTVEGVTPAPVGTTPKSILFGLKLTVIPITSSPQLSQSGATRITVEI